MTDAEVLSVLVDTEAGLGPTEGYGPTIAHVEALIAERDQLMKAVKGGRRLRFKLAGRNTRLRGHLEDALQVLSAEEADYDAWTALVGRIRKALEVDDDEPEEGLLAERDRLKMSLNLISAVLTTVESCGQCDVCADRAADAIEILKAELGPG